jgi:hypothetical protein
MHTVLDKEFGHYYKIEDPIFGTTLARTILHAKIIEKRQKRKAE